MLSHVKWNGTYTFIDHIIRNNDPIRAIPES